MRVPRIGAWVISPKDVSMSWVGLYVVTFALQVPCAVVRGFVIYPIVWLTFKLVGEPTGAVHAIVWIVEWGPLVGSLATLIVPLGGWWWEQQVGGRAPSERERLVYEDAIAQLRQADPKLREPRRWFVVDEGKESAAAYGDTLMVSRGLLDGGYLEAVMAHELGHLNSSDGRLAVALDRLVTPPRGVTRRGLKMVCFVLTGAIGMWPLRAAWSAYWREREHCADEYAARLGQADTLGSFLDDHRGYDAPVPHRWLSDHKHPPTEHRVDRLSHGVS